MNDAQKLEVLIDLKEAAEYRLRKGPDNGDQSTVRIATEALAKITR